MNVLGFDPGFASLGWGAVRLLPTSEEFLELGVIETEKSDKKLRVLASDDNMRRTRELSAEVLRIIDRFQPAVMCLEAMSFTRHASVANKMGMARGAVACASVARGDIPFVEATPQQIKQALCDCRDASKQDVQEALERRFGMRMVMAVSDLKKAQREHPSDALGAIVACLDSEVIRMGRRMAIAAGQ